MSYQATRPCPPNDRGPNVGVYPGWDLQTLYRTFPERLWAKHFCQGRIRISTLSSFRSDPHPTRGDPGEGTSTHRTAHVSTDSPHELERFMSMQRFVGLVNCTNS